MSDIKGAAARDGVGVEVHPGGALAALTLTPAALDLGAAVLARTVVEAVAAATAVANQRTEHALADALERVDPATLGLPRSAALTDQAESPVPATRRLR